MRENAQARLAMLPGDLRFLAQAQETLARLAALTPAERQAEGLAALREFQAGHGI